MEDWNLIDFLKFRQKKMKRNWCFYEKERKNEILVFCKYYVSKLIRIQTWRSLHIYNFWKDSWKYSYANILKLQRDSHFTVYHCNLQSYNNSYFRIYGILCTEIILTKKFHESNFSVKSTLLTTSQVINWFDEKKC